MNMKLKDKEKKLITSFKYAIYGFKHTFKTERNMMIHVLVSFMVIIMGIILKINLIEWCICLSLFALVIGSELINTALEHTVDLVEKKYSLDAKLAKDTAAAFVLTFAILSVIIGLLIFVPKILEFWR